MAWNLTLQDASFRGVTFEVQSVEDRGEKALCVHEYPYRSGAEVEDLGRKPRVIPVTAIFWGVAYESRIKALVAAFEEAGPGELIHPVFGSLTVAVRRWQIQHSAERHDYATVTFEAVEAVTDNPFFGATSSRSLAEQALADISSSLDEALGLSESELGKTLGQWADTAANIKARVETELQGVLDVLDSGRSVVRSVLSYVDVPAAFVADAQAIVRGLQADAASASSSVVSAFGVLSTALPLVSLTAPEAVKAYATGAGAYGPAWVSGPQSALSGKAEAQLALRVPRPAVATIPVPEAGSARTPQGVAVTHVTLLEAQATAQAASEALKADMASPALTPGEIEGWRAMYGHGWMTLCTIRRRPCPRAACIPSASACAQRRGPCSSWPRPPSMPVRRWPYAPPGWPAISICWPTASTATSPARTNCGASIRKCAIPTSSPKIRSCSSMSVERTERPSPYRVGLAVAIRNFLRRNGWRIAKDQELLVYVR